MKSLLKIITIILIASNSWANCKPVTYLDIGNPAPCKGYLFTPEKEQEIYIKLEELKKLQEIDKLQEERYNHTKTSLDEYIKYSQELEKSHRKQAVTNDLTKILYFVGGVAVSYFMFKVGQQ